MKRDNEYLKFTFIGFLALVIAYSVSFIITPKISQDINDLSSWYTYNFSKKSTQPYQLIGIAVDDYSLNKIHQRWPWKRSVYAQLLKILDREKVSTIGFDFTFVGESEDKEDDLALKEALSSISSRAVLAYFFDLEKAVPVLPLAGLKEAAYSVGMINTPVDSDGKIRRLRGYIETAGDFYYSFAVNLAAAHLKQKPQDIVSHLPLSKDRTFVINYLLKPKDIIKLSFYDVLTNLEALKKQYGNDFLKGTLVLVYPEAEILHDTHATPLGKMPGGFTHLNGAADILLKRFIKEVNTLSIPFLIFSFLALLYLLRYTGFIAGSLFAAGVLALDFWGLVLLSFKGLRFNYSYIAIFCLSFFALGNLYKYLYFLAQILKIKDKATLDPLRNLFTPRYFYYRLGLETKKMYFHKDLFLVFIYLESFREATEDMPLEKTKELWQRISALLARRGILWSVYSQDELTGCLVSSASRIKEEVESLKSGLEALLSGRDINCRIKLAYVKFKKNYPISELLFVLSTDIRKQPEEVMLFKDENLEGLLTPAALKTTESGKLLESVGEDIEDKNKQLLSLIDNLSKEHAKTKEAFFQIIASLVNALEARDSYTEGHSERVSSYAVALAEKMGWPLEQKEKLRKAALLHDLGKIGIPDAILHKRGQLNPQEYDIIKKHEVIGVKILEPLKEMSDILPWILYHHERWDGKGYPHGLKGDAIPQAAQIISLADVYDALTTGRDYKKAFPAEEAISEIVKNKGTQFNPRFVDIFVDLILSQKQKP